jgi:hypothetical protein
LAAIIQPFGKSYKNFVQILYLIELKKLGLSQLVFSRWAVKGAALAAQRSGGGVS